MSNNAFAGISFGYDSKNVFDYRENNSCNNWKSCFKDIEPMSLVILKNDVGNYVVNGTLKGVMAKLGTSDNAYLKYWAANSPNYSTNYSGSALPFPNEEVAFDDTNNYGIVKVNSGSFSINLNYPNSYYKNMGTVYVPPQVKLRLVTKDGTKISEVYKINLGDGVPFRSLTWPRKRDWNSGPMFYCNNNLPVRTQEQILQDSAYPCKNEVPKNFWGLRPPN